MKNFRFCSIVLSFLMLVSCGKEVIPSETTETDNLDTPAAETAPADAPDLPDVDYDGHNFNVLLQATGFGIYNNEHVFVEGENGEILNDAIFHRNFRVEERFNTKVTETVLSNDPTATLKNAVAADEDTYDLVMFTWFPTYLGTDYLIDINSLSYVDLDKPWWDQNYSEAMSIGGKLTTAVSSLMITHMDSVLSMFYNKSLADAYNLPDLYQIVRDGDWTLDKWAEISKGVSTDLNGDGTMDDLDLYAFLGLDGAGRLASGVPLYAITKDSDGIPQTNFGSVLTDRLMTITSYAEKYQDDIYDPRTDRNTAGDGDRAVFRLYLNNQALFFVHGLGSSQMYRDMESDFGVLPTPKLDETQESYFSEPDLTKCFAIPLTASDLDRTAVILEALSYEGYTYLKPLYYESMLQSKYLRDVESIEMMDQYIYPNIGFSLHACIPTLQQTIRELVSGKQEVASFLKSKQNVIEKEIADYISLFP